MRITECMARAISYCINEIYNNIDYDSIYNNLKDKKFNNNEEIINYSCLSCSFCARCAMARGSSI